MSWCAGYRITRHARERQREMRVTDQELARLLRAPEQIYDQSNYGEGKQMYQGGRIAAVVANKQTVITVLWNTQDDYTRTKP